MRAARPASRRRCARIISRKAAMRCWIRRRQRDELRTPRRRAASLSYGRSAMASHPFDLGGKVTLITGANSGLGFGFADAIARAGGDVVILGRREDRNAEAAERLRAHAVRVHTDAVDVSDEAAQLRGFARALDAM